MFQILSSILRLNCVGGGLATVTRRDEAAFTHTHTHTLSVGGVISTSLPSHVDLLADDSLTIFSFSLPLSVSRQDVHLHGSVELLWLSLMSHSVLGADLILNRAK